MEGLGVLPAGPLAPLLPPVLGSVSSVPSSSTCCGHSSFLGASGLCSSPPGVGANTGCSTTFVPGWAVRGLPVPQHLRLSPGAHWAREASPPLLQAVQAEQGSGRLLE